MTNNYQIKGVSSNNKTTKQEVPELNRKTETLDIEDTNEEKIVMLEALKENIKNNREITNYFNQELYKRVNDEIKNLSQDEVNKHHGAR